jgi:hypothetical protein
VIQAFQAFMQTKIIASALQLRQARNIPWQLRLLSKIPVIRDLPPRMIAFGPKRVKLKESGNH